LQYLGGAETYQWGGGDKDPTKGHHDFWSDHEPAIDLVPFIDYSANFYSERTSVIIAEHATRKAGQPLWLHVSRARETKLVICTELIYINCTSTPFRTSMHRTHSQWPGRSMNTRRFGKCTSNLPFLVIYGRF
jgi:hypothetical protein